jgi:hypothetical protein
MIHASATLTAHVHQALQRCQSKASVDAVLRGLSLDEAQAVLVDLLTAYDQEASGRSSVSPPGVRVGAPKAGPASSPAADTGPVPQPLSVTPVTGISVADRLLAVLQAQPEAPIQELTRALYGTSDAVSRNRLSTVLSQLRRRGKVHMVRRGKWRVVEPKRSVKRGPSARKAVAVAAKVPAKRKQIATKPAPSKPTPFAADWVRSLLLSHPEGLTTGQIRQLLRPDPGARPVNTVVSKMRARGLLVATGERGSSVYKLSQGSSAGGE